MEGHVNLEACHKPIWEKFLMKRSLSGSLFAYQWRDTVLHNRAVGIKLCGCLACAPISFSLPRAWLFIPAIVLLLLVIIAQVPASSLLRIVRILGIYGLFLLLLRFNVTDSLISQFASELPPTAEYLFRLALIFLSSTIFYETTSPAEIRRLLEGLANRSPPFFHFLAGLPVLFSLTLGFIPRIFILWQNLDRAWNARAGGRSISSVWQRITRIVPALILLALAQASDTDRALRNRN